MEIGKVSIIGAGAWGTALANHVARGGKPTLIWAYEKDVVADINNNGANSTFLPGVALDRRLEATDDLARAAAFGDAVIFAAPSHVMETVLGLMVPSLRPEALVVSVTKGIENRKLRLPSQIFGEYLSSDAARRLVCFSGPSFALEVAQGLPTAITAASSDPGSARSFQKLMSHGQMRVYTNGDVIGVEVGGVVKNVVAIAAGISDGMELGHNTRAAIISRGLEETIRLGVAMGAKEKTFRGLSGIGDLVLTASGDLSRNRTVGKRLGKGEKLPDIVKSMKNVAEGVLTSRSIHLLSQRLGVVMPLCREVYYVCHENKEPRQALEDLINRELKDEFDG